MKITNAHCLVLEVLSNGPIPTCEVSKKLGLANGTTHSQIVRMRDLGLLAGWRLTDYGKEILKRYRGGEEFESTKPRTCRITRGEQWVDRYPKKPPEWNHGLIYEDAPGWGADGSWLG